MKTNYVKTLALLVMAGVFGLSSAQGASWPDDDWQSQRLEGTWMFQISLQDCSLGTPIGAPFLSLLTFARGGTVTETTSNPMFFPAVRGPGHGIWRTARYHGYKAVTTAFITVNGALTRTQTITQAIEVERDGSLKTTSASVKFYAPNGTLLATGCAAATGKRVELED